MTQWGLDTLFNPAKRHMDEEKQRLQSTREEVGDASGGRRIDFESGKVTIRRSAPAEADAEVEEDTETDADTGTAAEADDGTAARAELDSAEDSAEVDPTT